MKILFNQREVAQSQLDRAAFLFLEERDYVSCVTLALAAEGILGEYLKTQRRKSHLDELNAAIAEFSGNGLTPKQINDEYINRARNFFKHSKGDIDRKFEFEPELEAITALVRGISNSAIVNEALSDQSKVFLKWLKVNHPELLDSDQLEKFREI